MKYLKLSIRKFGKVDGKNSIDFDRENRELKEMDSLKSVGLDFDKKYNELALFNKLDISCFRETAESLTNGQKRNLQ